MALVAAVSIGNAYIERNHGKCAFRSLFGFCKRFCKIKTFRPQAVRRKSLRPAAVALSAGEACRHAEVIGSRGECASMRRLRRQPTRALRRRHGAGMRGSPGQLQGTSGRARLRRRRRTPLRGGRARPARRTQPAVFCLPGSAGSRECRTGTVRIFEKNQWGDQNGHPHRPLT